MKGALLAMALFTGIIIPIFLTVALGGLHQFSFMKMTTEVGEIVKEEGGVTDRVTNVVGELEERNYVITFKDEDGNAVVGKKQFGDRITIDYEYKYRNPKGIQDLHTQNVVHISTR